jgi:hypothetical protein
MSLTPTGRHETRGAGPRASAAVARALAGAVLLAACSAEVRQPIEYSHRLHVKELGLGCEHCHETARSGEAAGMPALATCAECHQEAMGSSSEERKIVAAVAAGEEISWGRLYDLPSHVYFTHRRHVTSAEIACERCHGDMGAQSRPPPVPLVSMSMDACMSCHRAQGATRDCAACHR